MRNHAPRYINKKEVARKAECHEPKRRRLMQTVAVPDFLSNEQAQPAEPGDGGDDEDGDDEDSPAAHEEDQTHLEEDRKDEEAWLFLIWKYTMGIYNPGKT